MDEKHVDLLSPLITKHPAIAFFVGCAENANASKMQQLVSKTNDTTFIILCVYVPPTCVGPISASRLFHH